MKGQGPSTTIPARPAVGTRRPGRTLADYVGIALGPVLIMLLVGSLIFFLIEIGYRGSFTGHIRWTLFWFTVAAVLVSRISIEQGAVHGAIYGVALGAATGLRLCQFLGAPLSALVLLALIWWCAGKLTWDCTVIDDDEDASGQGLLQTAGFESGGIGNTAAEPDPAGPGGGADPDAPAFEPVRPRKPHAPGLWVVYFSMGALPVFGLGQWTIPVTDSEARFRAFLLCLAYVFSALALLLTTSFLGLRRYLRQRHLTMPVSMARSWMVFGGTMLVAVLLGALLLPRPRGLDSLARFAFGLRERPPQASRFAWMRGEAAQGEGRRIGTSSDSRQGGSPGESRAAGDSGPGNEGESGQGDGGAGKDPGGSEQGRDGGGRDGGSDQGEGRETGGTNPDSGDRTQEAGGSDAPGNGGTPPVSSPAMPSIPEGAVSLLRWISLGLGAALLVYLLVRFGRQWLAALRAALASGKRPVTQGGPEAGKRRMPAFNEYPDPFANGTAARMTPEQLVTYSFDALQAWASDAGRARPPEQTPVEFGSALVRSSPEIADEIQSAIRLYVRTAYAGAAPSSESVQDLRRLWQAMGAFRSPTRLNP